MGLYYEKEPNTQFQEEVERIITKWGNKVSKATSKNDEFKFSNIKITEMPAYYFQFDFQIGKRTYSIKEKPYSSGNEIPNNPISLKDFSFKNGILPDIPVQEEYYDDSKWFPDSQTLYRCPICRGEKNKECPDCNGTGIEQCPKCKGSPAPGYIRCTNCKDGLRSDGSKCNDCRDGWIVCPQCRGSSHGNGRITCRRCKGVGDIRCSRCNGSGKVVEYVALEEYFEPLEDAKYSHFLWHDLIPTELKDILTGNSVDAVKSSCFFKAYSNLEPIFDAENKPNEVFNTFNFEKSVSLQNKYKEFLSDVSKNYEVDNDFQVGTRSFTTTQITKVRTLVFVVNVSHVTYECNSKNYELWLYGNNNEIFTLDSPFMELANQKMNIANEFISKKNYVHAINSLEAACKIADNSFNHKAFNEYAGILKQSREKASIDYLIGLLIGLGLLIIYFLLSPIEISINNDVVSSLNIKSEKLAKITTKIVAIFAGIIVPLFFADFVVSKITRDKLKNKILRLLTGAVIPIIYILISKILSSFSWFSEKMLLSSSTFVFFTTIILAFVIKAPYEKYKMASYKKPKIVLKEKRKNTKTKTVEKSYYVEEISPKHRILALILSLFMGTFGVHNFYVGKFLHGILQVALFITGFSLISPEAKGFTTKGIIGIILASIVMLWATVDFFMILFGRFKDKNHLKIENWW